MIFGRNADHPAVLLFSSICQQRRVFFDSNNLRFFLFAFLPLISFIELTKASLWTDCNFYVDWHKIFS